MTVPLDVFFAEMAELLAGRRSPAECEAVLGPSPSGTARLGIYATLVDRQQQAALEALYRATLVAARSWDREACAELCAGYLRAAPPSHWAPAVVAAPFSDYLEPHGAPTDVVELADFARTRYEVLSAPAGDRGADLAVRHYTHAVREFTFAVEHEHRASGRPDAVASTWLFGRHRDTADLVLITPSLATLIVAHVLAEGWSPDLPPIAPGAFHEAAAFLHTSGLISATAVAALREAVPR